MNTRSAGTVFFLFIITFIGVRLFVHRPPPVDTAKTAITPTRFDIDSKAPTTEPTDTQGEMSESEPLPPIKEKLSPQEIAELTEVYENSVWINREAQAYPQYDKATLKAMAENGDIRAMKEIVYQLIHHGSGSGEYEKNPGKWVDEYRQYVTMAIIHGDREFLSMGKSIFVDNSDPEQSPKDALLSSLAYTEFMAMRGNTEGKYTYARDFIHVYTETHGPLSLTDGDRADIYLRAEEIYRDVESMRLDAGFPPFDNRVPNYILAMQKQYPSLYSEKAMRRRLGENDF